MALFGLPVEMIMLLGMEICEFSFVMYIYVHIMYKKLFFDILG